jgi:multimeric flavodoxin WrbA
VRLVLFHGSPRVGGNTDLLVTSVLKGIDRHLHRVDVFRLNEMSIRPCQNCGGCTDTGVCVLKDQMQQVYPVLRKADRVVLASPIYFSGLSAQTKAMIDRCQPLWCEKYIHNMPLHGAVHRKGLLILVGGMKKQVGADCAGATATAFFRSVSVEEHKTLAYLGIDAKGAILSHPTALNDVYEAAKQLMAH